MVFAAATVFEDRAGATVFALLDLTAACDFFAVEAVAGRDADVLVFTVTEDFFEVEARAEVAARAVLRDDVVAAVVLCRVAAARAREATFATALALDGAVFLDAGFAVAARPRAGADAAFLSFGAGRGAALPLDFRAGDRSVLLEPALALVDLSVFLTDDIRGALLFCSALETERSPSWPVRRTATLRF